jgi:hypothetical protein
VKRENGLLVSAVLVSSMRLSAVESFMRRAGSGGRVHAASLVARAVDCGGVVARVAVVGSSTVVMAN